MNKPGPCPQFGGITLFALTLDRISTEASCWGGGGGLHENRIFRRIFCRIFLQMPATASPAQWSTISQCQRVVDTCLLCAVTWPLCPQSTTEMTRDIDCHMPSQDGPKCLWGFLEVWCHKQHFVGNISFPTPENKNASTPLQDTLKSIFMWISSMVVKCVTTGHLRVLGS